MCVPVPLLQLRLRIRAVAGTNAASVVSLSVTRDALTTMHSNAVQQDECLLVAAHALSKGH